MRDLKLYFCLVFVRCSQYPSKCTGKLLSYNLCKNFSFFRRNISLTFIKPYSLNIGSVCDLYVLFVTTRLAFYWSTEISCRCTPPPPITESHNSNVVKLMI